MSYIGEDESIFVNETATDKMKVYNVLVGN